MIGKAIVFHDIDTPILQEIRLPPLSNKEVLVETAYSCISPGTELRVLSGRQPGVGFPCIPGYSLSGRVLAVGDEVDIKEGTPVFCTGTIAANVPLAWGGHVSHAVVPAEDVFCIPEGVDLLNASTTKIAAIPHHGMRLSHPLPHEKILIIGLGIIGQFSTRLHALSGADVLGVDIAEERVNLIKNAGINAVTSLSEARAHFPDGADVIVDATGLNAVLREGIEFARDIPWNDGDHPHSRYIVQGSYPEDFCIPYQTAFSKGLSFILPRDSQPRDFRAVLDHMQSGVLQIRDLIGEIAKPSNAPTIYRALRNREFLSAVFEWNS